ncbi:hypothetical protein KUTeg_012451 [Tegillarca granosa]|uniref:Uncharacterized protein n=1 Tax=Tegillarca granosa TaxID=220873 RepID=A0ABQ9F315_TEGGR|nr:hypothetical protein KUTeg_012451 [Tegillarca granosa]
MEINTLSEKDEREGNTGNSDMDRNTVTGSSEIDGNTLTESNEKVGSSEVDGNIFKKSSAMHGNSMIGNSVKVENTDSSIADGIRLAESSEIEKNILSGSGEKYENTESSDTDGDTLARCGKMDGVTIEGSEKMNGNTLLSSGKDTDTGRNGNAEISEMESDIGTSEIDGNILTGSSITDGKSLEDSSDLDRNILIESSEMDRKTLMGSSEIDRNGLTGSEMCGDTEIDRNLLRESNGIDRNTGKSETNWNTIKGSDGMHRNIGDNEMDGNKLTGSSEIDVNTGSSEMNENTGSNERNRNTRSIEHNTVNIKMENNTGSIEMEHSTESIEMKHNTGSKERNGNTDSIEMEHNTGSKERNGNTDSIEMEHNTGSIEIEHNTGSIEIEHNTGSIEMEHNTGSFGMEQNMGSIEIDGNILTGNRIYKIEDLSKDNLQKENPTGKIDEEKRIEDFTLDFQDLHTGSSTLCTSNLLLKSTVDPGGTHKEDLNITTNLQYPVSVDPSDTEMDMLHQSDAMADTTITDEDDAEFEMEEEEVSHFATGEAENQCREITKEIRVPVHSKANILIQLPIKPIPVYSRVTVYKQNGPTILTAENGKVVTTDSYRGRVKYINCNTRGVVKIQINHVKLDDEGMYMTSCDDVVVQGPVLKPYIPTDITLGIDKTALMMLSCDESRGYQSFEVVKEDSNQVQSPVFSINSQNDLNLEDNYRDRIQFQGDMKSGRCWFELHKITLEDSGKYMLKHGGETLASQRLMVHSYQTYCQKRGAQKAKKNYRDPEVIAGEMNSLREYLHSRRSDNIECTNLLNVAITKQKLKLKLNYKVDVAGKVGYKTIYSGRLQIQPNIFLIRENCFHKKELSKRVYEKSVQLLLTKTPEEILKQVDPGPYQCPESDELKLEKQNMPNYDEQARNAIMDAAINKALPKERFDEMIRNEYNRESLSEESILAAIKARVQITQGPVNYNDLLSKADVQTNENDLIQRGKNPNSIQDVNKFVVIERAHVVDDRKSFAFQILTDSANNCGLIIKWLVTSPVYSVPKTPLFVFRNCVSYEEIVIKSDEMKQCEGDREDYGITDSGVDKWFIRAVEDVLIHYKNQNVIDPLRIMSGFDKKEEEQIKLMCRNLQLEPKLRREGLLRMFDIEKPVKPEDIVTYLSDENNKSDKYSLMSVDDRYTIAEVMEMEIKDKISI